MIFEDYGNPVRFGKNVHLLYFDSATRERHIVELGSRPEKLYIEDCWLGSDESLDLFEGILSSAAKRTGYERKD
jgi:hypothetical protein